MLFVHIYAGSVDTILFCLLCQRLVIRCMCLTSGRDHFVYHASKKHMIMKLTSC